MAIGLDKKAGSKRLKFMSYDTWFRKHLNEVHLYAFFGFCESPTVPWIILEGNQKSSNTRLTRLHFQATRAPGCRA